MFAAMLVLVVSQEETLVKTLQRGLLKYIVYCMSFIAPKSHKKILRIHKTIAEKPPVVKLG